MVYIVLLLWCCCVGQTFAVKKIEVVTCLVEHTDPITGVNTECNDYFQICVRNATTDSFKYDGVC